MTHFLSYFESGRFGDWLKAIWHRHVAAYKARARRQAMLRGEPVEPPRVLTLEERMAALEPEIHALRTHEKRETA